MLSPGFLGLVFRLSDLLRLVLILVEGKLSIDMFGAGLFKEVSRGFSLGFFEGDLDLLCLAPNLDGEMGGDIFFEVEWLYNGQLLLCIRREEVELLLHEIASDSSTFDRWHFGHVEKMFSVV